MPTIKFTADIPAILKEIVKYFDGSDRQLPAVPGIVQALNMLRIGLVNIGNRSIVLDDAVLLSELEQLGIIKPKNG